MFQRAAADLPPPRSKPRAPVDPSLGKWEKHTKGIASKLMQKMGFSGRLGSNESGVSKTVEVVVRPNNLGLGFGQFKEASALRVNKRIEAELHGKETDPDPQETRHKAATPAHERLVQEENWRKGRKRKAGRVGKATDVKAADAAKMAVDLVIDMRGPAPESLNTDPALPPLLGEELLYNVSMSLRNAEAASAGADHLLATHRSRGFALDRDLAAARERLSTAEKRGDRLEALGKAIGKIDGAAARAAAADGDGGAPVVLNLVRELRKKFPEEYKMLRLDRVVPVLAAPLLAAPLERWAPLKDPARIVRWYLDWEAVLDGPAAATAFLRPKVLPGISRAVHLDWNAAGGGKGPDPCLELFRALGSVLEGGALRELLVDAVFPKLVRAVTDWKAGGGGVSLYLLVLPWIEHLDRAMLSRILPEVAQRLRNYLRGWSPEDRRAAKWLRPWMRVLDQKSTEALFSQHVCPKLARSLRSFRPDDAAAYPEYLSDWHDVLPSAHLLALVEGELALRWASAVHAAATSPDSGGGAAAARMYLAWRDVLPTHARDDRAIVAYLQAGLLAVRAAADRDADGLARLRPPRAATTSYAIALARRRSGGGRSVPSAAGAAARKDAGREVGRVSFRDIVEKFATDNDVEFRPAGDDRRRAEDGSRIFLFGEVSLYFDGDVAYAKSKGAGWDPVSLENILSRHRESGVTGGC